MQGNPSSLLSVQKSPNRHAKKDQRGSWLLGIDQWHASRNSWNRKGIKNHEIESLPPITREVATSGYSEKEKGIML